MIPKNLYSSAELLLSFKQFLSIFVTYVEEKTFYSFFALRFAIHRNTNRTCWGANCMKKQFSCLPLVKFSTMKHRSPTQTELTQRCFEIVVV